MDCRVCAQHCVVWYCPGIPVDTNTLEATACLRAAHAHTVRLESLDYGRARSG